MTARKQIAILGAGVGGLAAAAFLAADGHAVRVFDRFEAPRPVGSGLMIQATGEAVLRRLGIWDRLSALVAPISRLDGRTERDVRVLDVRFAALRPGLLAHGVLRPALFDALLTTAKSAGAALEAEAETVSVDAEAGIVRTAKGGTLGPFDIVVDALGARSPLSRPAAPLRYGALWGTVPAATGALFAPDVLSQRYRAASRMAGVMPSGRMTEGGEAQLTYFWSLRGDEAEGWPARFEGWREEATAFWPATEELLAALPGPDALTFARYFHRTERSPIIGARAARIGDAWHATSPQLGQGANTALLDAYALALSVRRTGGAGDLASLRRRHVALYQLMSGMVTPVYQSDGRALPWLRDRLAGPLMRSWPLRAATAAAVSGAFGSPLRSLGLDR